MTTNQFIKFAEDFATYANKETKFEFQTPSMPKAETYEGRIKGLGVGVNAEHIIIAWMGHRHAIHYSRVKLPG